MFEAGLVLNLQLARRIELAEAQAGAAAARSLGKLRPETGATVEQIAGGYAVFAGAGSPVTQAIALGLDGSVSEEEFTRLVSFYRERNEPVRVEACPLAHRTLFDHLGAAEYRVTEFTNVMAQRIEAEPPEPAPGAAVEVRRVGAEKSDLWNRTTAAGFSEDRPVGQELLDVMKAFALADGVECYLATVDGSIAGGGTLILRDGVAGFFGASTLPAFRRRGVQTALLRARMERARDARCDLAVCLAQPGSSSGRNATRLGFQVLYTRVKFESR